MCLAVPAQVVACLPDERAVIDLGGIRKEISVELIDSVAEGDYVIVHVGYAIGRLDEAEARRTLDEMARMAVALSSPTPAEATP